ncbi:MAG: bifunctional diaminohydroxyphosphoribosylaminopyrimidine deaminase/5-amino-6-(5-phosphoribosylamino)uracil reductase RibD [Candidatus Omnitrophota bacterium]
MRREDKKYMNLALELAKRGKGLTSPNPCVGAVVVKDGKIVGKGYHRKAGGLHAEIYALKRAGAKARGATLYVSLEPCRHYGKTLPCVDAIIASMIKRVVAAMKDPNPLNNGRGIAVLKRKGIEVEVGILEDEARRLNEAFIKYITKKIPFVTVKVAQSLDGKIATHTGNSKWITSEKAREFTHGLRSETDAILVGVETILKDDPLLTARLKVKRINKQPAKIILDSKLRTPTSAKIFSRGSPGKVIIATTKLAPKDKIEILKKKDAEILIVGSKNGKVNIKTLLRLLGEKGITHILVEGGGEVIASAFEAKVVDRTLFFVAPKIIGGREAPTSVEGIGVNKVSKAIKLKDIRFERMGDDFLVEGYVRD